MRSKPLAAKPMVVIGIRSFGRKNLFVHQDGQSQTPSFYLRPLTAEFLSNAIDFAPAFAFSIRSPRIGDVAYVSGAGGSRLRRGPSGDGLAGRDGNMEAGGLAIRLTNRTVFLDHPVRPEFRKDRFEIEVEIPWMILRFCSSSFIWVRHAKAATLFSCTFSGRPVSGSSRRI